MSTRNYIDLENLSIFWNEAKSYINNLDQVQNEEINNLKGLLNQNITDLIDQDKIHTEDIAAGHIAQEVQEVLPEFVRQDSGKDEFNYLSLDYNGLHSMQIKALKNKCERLEDENKLLLEMIEKLSDRISKLEDK